MSAIEKNPSSANGHGNNNKIVPLGSPIVLELPDGSRQTVPSGTTVGEILRDWPSPHPLVAAFHDYKIAPLEKKLMSSGRLEPLHLGMRDGALMYRRSLSFVLVRAVREIFSKVRVYISHSLSGGYYVELQPYGMRNVATMRPTARDLERIKERMRRIVEADEPFIRHSLPTAEAIQLFHNNGQEEKAGLLKWCGTDSVTVYTCGGHTNHFYGYLVPSTGYLKLFDLVQEGPGFVLMFPHTSDPTRLPPYEPQPKIFATLQEYDKWMRILGLDTVAQLNVLVAAGVIRDYVLIAEGLQEKKIARIADRITESPNKPKVVLMSGPSASGKTTSMKRLCIQLRVNGYRPIEISMDDFFVDRELTPRDASGDYDFESFDTIDHRKFNDTIFALLQGEEVTMPKYDFREGRSREGGKLRIDPDHILVVEGIHALNNNLLAQVLDGLKFRIYVSPLTHLNIDEHNRIPSSDARLLRRLVRDAQFRGYEAKDTLARWPSVRRGEEKNIFPYQEMADVVFNSSLPYEIGALAPMAVEALRKIDRTCPEFAEAARLLRFLSYFQGIPLEDVPRTSLLREFMGGSIFRY